MSTLTENEVLEVAGIPYFIMEDLTGFKHKVVDFDKHPMPRVGQIMFECIKKSDRIIEHGYSVGMTPDNFSGILFGIPIGVDNRSKGIKWMPIQIKTLMVYDLSVPNDRKKAIVLQRSAICEGSPNLSQNMKLHILRIHDSEKAAQNDIKRVLDGQRAVSIAVGLKGEELLDQARNLGIMPETTSLAVLTAEVLKRAEKSPEEFLRTYENPNKVKLTILKRCLDVGVIQHDAFSGYTYGGRPLGHNEPEVIEYLNKYPDISTTLDMRSREKLNQSVKAMAKAEPVNVTDMAGEIAALKKLLADEKAKNEELIAKDIREDDPAILAEYEKLMEESKELKFKGTHLFKPTKESVEKFRAKVEEAKKGI